MEEILYLRGPAIFFLRVLANGPVFFIYSLYEPKSSLIHTRLIEFTFKIVRIASWRKPCGLRDILF